MDNGQTQKVTLDDLAAMMQRQFDEFASKKDLSQLETNLAQILVKMNDRLDRIDLKLNQLGDMEAMQRRLEAMARVLHDKLQVDV